MEEAYLQELIRKYGNGTASTAEREELLSWYRSKNDEGYLLPYENTVEEEAARKRMLLHLRQEIRNDQHVKRKLFPLYLKIAAAAVLIVGLFLIFNDLKINGGNKDTLTYNTISTPAGGHKIIKLSDGTTIWLSAKSKLRYPLAFVGSTREITFEGEAFFDVAKDKHHPFIVHTGITSTRVLGTSFNITALKNKPDISVSLLTGKVAFSAGQTKLKLLPGQQIVYNKLKKRANLQDIRDIAGILSRRDGDYEYKNVRVEDVIEDVNLNFNTNIKVEGEVKNCAFFGRIKHGENMMKFLKRLTIVNKAELIQSNGGYIIKGGGCD
jgi:transmembrane sensor